MSAACCRAEPRRRPEASVVQEPVLEIMIIHGIGIDVMWNPGRIDTLLQLEESDDPCSWNLEVEDMRRGAW